MRSLEYKLVEKPLIDALQKSGWKHIPGDDLERDNLKEPLLTGLLARKIHEINKNLSLSDTEVWEVIRELQLRSARAEDQKKLLQYYQHGMPIRIERLREVRYVQLFDFKVLERNELIVSNQVIHLQQSDGGEERNRNDIILYINGIPIVNIECKNPASLTESWTDAYDQIKGFEKIIPELYKYVQIGIAAEEIFKFFPIVPWLEDVKVDEWKLEQENYEPIDAIISMLTPATLLDLLQYFVLMRKEHGEQTKVLPRYIQYRAANKMVQRVIDNLNNKTEKSKGLIWHWQGSGKTLSMIFAANKLYHLELLQNPSIFFIVDRIDLEDQLYIEYTGLNIPQPEIIQTISELRQVLEHDGNKGKRGIMIVLIHKFQPDELYALQQELVDTEGSITQRKNVVVFIDEGHRSQYGVMAAQMKEVFKNAFFFALTGTPIKKSPNRNTYKEFGYPDDEDYYLDRYFIRDAINDGYAVKIAYQPRLEKEDVHLNKEMLKIFLETELEEIPEQFHEGVESGVKHRLNRINMFLEHPNRIEKIAEDISQDFLENVDGKFKAMVVAASRKACVLYKRALDELLPPDYSEIVMTHADDDIDIIRGYTAELTKRYGTKDTDAINKLIRENYRDENALPKILIVTSKLLTGFDARILRTMYLDKPLKEHRLLQAIARTNRPYKDVKEAGLILDYVGIFKEIKKALEQYHEKDLQGAIYSMDEIRTEFHDLIIELLDIFKDIETRDYEKETFLKAIEILTTGEEIGEQFQETYRHMRRVFELLGADAYTLEWFKDYKWLSSIYAYYFRKVIQDQPSYARDAEKYFAKTVKYVHKTTEFEEINQSLPVLELDSEYIQKLEERVTNQEEKAANIVFTLNRFRLTDKLLTPINETLLDRVEGIIKKWREKSKNYEEIYQEGAAIIQEMQRLDERQKKTGLSDLEYAFLLNIENTWGTNDHAIEDVQRLNTQLEEDMFPGWISQLTAKKNIEQKIRKFTRRYGKDHGKSINEIDDLYIKLLESVKAYAKSS